MSLNVAFLLLLYFITSECVFKSANFVKEPEFSNQICTSDQVEFQAVTRSAFSCVRTCDITPGCKSLIYIHDNKTYYGIKSRDPFGTSSSLPGAAFFRPSGSTSSTTTTTTTSPTPTTTYDPGVPMVVGVPDSKFTTSSILGSNYVAAKAKFNNTVNSWVPETQITGEWVQVDFGTQIQATTVMTKGTSGFDDWVTSYKVHTSTVRLYDLCCRLRRGGK